MPKANPMRGEALLGEHKLSVTFNDFCNLQGATGMDMTQLIEKMGTTLAGDPLALRTWTRVFLVEDKSAEEVGDIIGELGIEATFGALNKAVDGFFSPMKEKSENPPKAE